MVYQSRCKNFSHWLCTITISSCFQGLIFYPLSGFSLLELALRWRKLHDCRQKLCWTFTHVRGDEKTRCSQRAGAWRVTGYPLWHHNGPKSRAVSFWEMEEAKDVKFSHFPGSSLTENLEQISQNQSVLMLLVASPPASKAMPTLHHLSICSHHPTDSGLAVLQAAAAETAAEMVALLL